MLDQDLDQTKAKEKVREALQRDIHTYLTSYPKKSKGIKALAEGSAIACKTIRRIIDSQNYPSYQTILKIYSHILGTEHVKETILAMPQIMSEFIIKEYSKNDLSNPMKIDLSEDIDRLIEKDQIFRGIYIETMAGAITKEKIEFLFGIRSIDTLNEMLRLNVIKQSSPNSYCSSTRRASINLKSRRVIAESLIKNNYYEEKEELPGENFSMLFVGSLKNEAVNDILKILAEARKKIKNIMNDKNNIGKNKTWVSSFLDTLTSKFIYDDYNKEKL